MNENVTVCITPKGDKPVLHFSQFDNERVFTVTVLADDGESAAVLTGLDIEFRLRKTDSHVVTIAPESVHDNVITFKTTEQMCACCGQNIATVTLMKDDMVVSTLAILVDIQRDILSGGLTSESDIRNLTTQIEQIVPEVIGDDYYNKQEVDDLLAEHTFDPSNYYDKSDVDDLLDDKADSDDVYTKSDVYNKTETDNLLSAKMDSIGYHGIVDDASVISFTTNCNAPLDIIKGKITPVQSGTGTPSPQNVRPISGFSALNVTLADGDMQTVESKTVNFGQTVYDGVADVTNGKVNVTHEFVTLNGSEAWGSSGSIYTLSLSDMESGTDLDGITNYIQTVHGAAPVDRVSIRFGYNSKVLYVYQANNYLSGVSDLASFKTYLSNNPLEVCYPLATPIEIDITPETVSSIAGDNNIFLDTGNLTEIAYFENAEDNLIKLIKACQI